MAELEEEMQMQMQMWKWHVECCKLNVGFLNCCHCVGESRERGGRGGDNQDDAYKLCDLNEEQQRAKANAAGS